MKKLILLSIIIFHIFVMNMTVQADIKDNNVKVIEVISLTEYVLEDNQTIELFGVECEFYKKFYNDIYIEDYSTLFSPEIDNMPSINRVNFEEKSIIEEHEKAVSFIKSILIDNEVNVEYIDKNRVILSVNEVNLNEYLLKSGLVRVEIEDSVVNEGIISNYFLLENEASINEIGIWGMSFSVTWIEGVGSSGFADYNYFITRNIILLIVALMFVFWINRLKSFLKFMVTISFYMLAYTVCLIGGPNSISTEVPHIISYLMMSSMLLIALFHFIWNVVVKYKEKSYIYLFINFILITLLIILIFSFIYFYISLTERTVGHTYYDYPNFEFSIKEQIITPYKDYIAVPLENYNINQLNNVNHYMYQFSMLDSFYFSSATYFTVGFGDYQPKGSLKLISIIEMIISYTMTILIFGMTISKYSSKD